MGLISKAIGKVTGVFGGDAVDDAAKASARGYRLSKQDYEAAKSQALPLFDKYSNLGELGTNALAAAAKGDYSQFYESPDYRFAFDEGQRAVDSSGAARGMQLSGAQLKALTKYGQGAATQNYGNWFNRNLDLADVGYNSDAAKGNIIMNTGNNLAAATQGISNSRASGYLGRAGIQNGILNSLVNVGTSFIPGG